MLSIVRGNTAELSFEIEGLDLGVVDSAVFYFKGIDGEVSKAYPLEVSYDAGSFIINLSSKDTMLLSGVVDMQAKVNYKNGDAAQTDIINVVMDETICEGR